MGFTLIGPWNYPCKDIVFPHIGIIWCLHWSNHETAYTNHCLATHWYYMGVYSGWPMNLHMKSHCFSTHGVYIGRPMKRPMQRHCLSTHWNCMVPGWSAHEVAHVKPLFCHSLVLHGAHINWPMKLHVKPLFCQTLALHGIYVIGPWNYPCINTDSPHIGITWASHWLAHEIAHVKPLFCHSLVVSEAHIGRPMKLLI